MYETSANETFTFFLSYNMITSILGTLMKKKEHNGIPFSKIDSYRMSLNGMPCLSYTVTSTCLSYSVFRECNVYYHGNHVKWVLPTSSQTWSVALLKSWNETSQKNSIFLVLIYKIISLSVVWPCSLITPVYHNYCDVMLNPLPNPPQKKDNKQFGHVPVDWLREKIDHKHNDNNG